MSLSQSKLMRYTYGRMSEKHNHSPYQVGIFFVLFGLIGVLSFLVLRPYLSLVFFSLIYSILIWPLYQKISKKMNNRRSVSALLTIVLSILVLVIPGLIFAQTLVYQAITVITDIRSQVGPNTFEEVVAQINTNLQILPFAQELEVTSQQLVQIVSQNIQPVSDWFLNSFWQIGNFSISFMINFILLIILVYFILPNLPDLKRYIYKISPLSSDATHQYFSRAYAMLLDVIKGTFLIAILQGLVGGIFLAIIGVPAWVLFAFCMMILSMIPILGTGFVLVPIGIVFLLTGHPFLGILTMCWQFFVVGTIDNIVRSMVVSKVANVHPALMMVAVLGGIQAFGFLGLVYGPLILVIFVTTLEVYRQEYHQ